MDQNQMELYRLSDELFRHVRYKNCPWYEVEAID